jgi:hypothetical protein
MPKTAREKSVDEILSKLWQEATIGTPPKDKIDKDKSITKVKADLRECLRGKLNTIINQETNGGWTAHDFQDILNRDIKKMLEDL